MRAWVAIHANSGFPNAIAIADEAVHHNGLVEVQASPHQRGLVMSVNTRTKKQSQGLSRRNFMAATGAGLAAASSETVLASQHATAPSVSSPQGSSAPTPPFDTFRDWIAALDAHGLVMRFDRVDQDAYEGTSIMYRLIDEFGVFGAPTVLFEEVKINGEWIQGPVIANHCGHWDAEALAFGLTPDPVNSNQSFRKARAYLMDMIEAAGGTNYPQIEPVEVSRDNALCKEVVLRGDEIDLTRFAFIKTNPGDADRYINTGSIFTSDPDMGLNFGTYRCQLKGPRKIGVNPEPGQTGWRMLMAAKERDETMARMSIVLGHDPIVWMVSSSRVANRRGDEPINELALAGGIRGKALDIVKSETNDFLVPAHAEMIIEGEVPLDDFEPEGPFGEMYGYLGLPKDENFYMNVTAVTHRRNPWILNSFTGVSRASLKAPGSALSLLNLKQLMPQLGDYHSRNDVKGVTFLSIDKTGPGQGLEIGKQYAELVFTSKIVMVVDSDLDVMKMSDMMVAFGSRWQPHPATHIYEDARGLDLDPSSPERGKTSKIVIDATRQWPEEGGPQEFAPLNRTLLEEAVPDGFTDVDAKWGETIKQWGRSKV